MKPKTRAQYIGLAEDALTIEPYLGSDFQTYETWAMYAQFQAQLAQVYATLALAAPAEPQTDVNAELISALEDALLLLENGDFRNGVTAPCGTDEGDVKAWEIMRSVKAAIAKHKGGNS